MAGLGRPLTRVLAKHSTTRLDVLFGTDGEPNPDLGLTGRHHPTTSQTARPGGLPGQRAAILALLLAEGDGGVTAADLVAEGICPSTQLAGARLLELRGARQGFDRIIDRAVNTSGALIVRARDDGRAGAVHYLLTGQLPDGARFENLPAPAVCRCCGQTIKARTP